MFAHIFARRFDHDRDIRRRLVHAMRYPGHLGAEYRSLEVAGDIVNTYGVNTEWFRLKSSFLAENRNSANPPVKGTRSPRQLRYTWNPLHRLEHGFLVLEQRVPRCSNFTQVYVASIAPPAENPTERATCEPCRGRRPARPSRATYRSQFARRVIGPAE